MSLWHKRAGNSGLKWTSSGSGSETVQPNSSLEAAWDEQDGPAVRTVTAVVVGCGNRGQNYAAFALDFPSRLKIVAVAEPVSLKGNRSFPCMEAP